MKRAERAARHAVPHLSVTDMCDLLSTPPRNLNRAFQAVGACRTDRQQQIHRSRIWRTEYRELRGVCSGGSTICPTGAGRRSGCKGVVRWRQRNVRAAGTQSLQPVLRVWEIQKELNRQSPWPLNIQEQSLVTAHGDHAAEAKFVEYLGALYAQRPPDLVVAFGAAAGRFMQQHRAELFPTTPMLLAAVEVRRVEPPMLFERDVVAGVRHDQVAAIENVLRLLPETKAIAIIIGNSPLSDFGLASTNGYWVRC